MKDFLVTNQEDNSSESNNNTTTTILLHKPNSQSLDLDILYDLQLELEKVRTLDKSNKKPYLPAISLYNYFNSLILTERILVVLIFLLQILFPAKKIPLV